MLSSLIRSKHQSDGQWRDGSKMWDYKKSAGLILYRRGKKKKKKKNFQYRGCKN